MKYFLSLVGLVVLVLLINGVVDATSGTNTLALGGSTHGRFDVSSIGPAAQYRGFRAFEFGYASAIAAALVVVATAVSLVIVKFSGFAKMRSTLEGM